MDFKKNWLEILLVTGGVLSLALAFVWVSGISGIEAELVAAASGNPAVQEFVSRYPGSAPHMLKIAPKGIFGVKLGEEIDPNFRNYEDDPLVGIIQENDFGEPFPDVWILVYSPEQVRREGYIAPHPPNPAAYVFFGADKKILFVEVRE